MLMLTDRLGVDVARLRLKHLPSELVRLHFTSKRKRMSTLTKSNGETEPGFDRRLHTKGAAEQVLQSCSRYIDEQGTVQTLSEEVKQLVTEKITEYANQSLRTICFAYKDLKPMEGGESH